MPRSSSLLFFSGVFCLFAAIVLISGSMSLEFEPPLALAANAVVGGALGALWAFAGTRRILWMFWVLAVLQTGASIGLSLFQAPSHSLAASSAALTRRLRAGGGAEIALIVAGYVLLTIFFNLEGAKFFRTETEVRLAGELHRALVPAQHQTIGAIELFGCSAPSGEVGGDLFDIIRSSSGWHAYVADVSGHGVAAGILMSMIKSTAAMQLTKLDRPASLLTDLNDVLQPFTSPANYLTFAYVGGNGAETLNFSLAGHLPILHYQRLSRGIVEHSDANVPIGMFRNQSFAMSRLALAPGDLLAIITDGFTEVFDRQQREIGLEDFKHMLLGCATRPLPEIYSELRASTLKHGKQVDDQTMLLIRRLP